MVKAAIIEVSNLDVDRRHILTSKVGPPTKIKELNIYNGRGPIAYTGIQTKQK